MKAQHLLVMALCGGAMFAANQAKAQETVTIAEEQITVADVNCKTQYSTGRTDNWFLQFGAGVNVPFVENSTMKNARHDVTAAYNIGFGKWFSPYIGWRTGFQYSQMKWNTPEAYGKNKARYITGNVDLMWDMTNSLGGVNASRPVSVIPFVGIGGTYTWDFEGPGRNVVENGGELRSNTWSLPVSAGLQLRFRLCKYVDFFLEGRAGFYADNFNNTVYGKPIDINISALGGFNINFGGRDYQAYNACNDLAYISSLNNQVNELRADLAATGAALAVAQSQLPCPEVTETVVTTPVVEAAPMLTTVRFNINSAVISSEEMVNVFNVAEYLKANPELSVAIVGYADKNTGTAAYNKTLSEKRAQAVFNALTKNYGINPDRLSVSGEGSSVQPYNTNNWNRIVIFVPQN
ncbi:MAG: OmpA family protein [Muribaculaceae bacterium]|nr:OmpA family protein [Muribaculaceae bacterium]